MPGLRIIARTYYKLIARFIERDYEGFSFGSGHGLAVSGHRVIKKLSNHVSLSAG